MLIEFYGKNFGCFRDEFRLSMLATDIDPDSDRGIVEVVVDGDDEPLRLLRCAAIYGPNASGKSTIIRAAGVLAELLRASRGYSSDESLEGYEPFALGQEPEEPVMLGLKAVVDGVVYDYTAEFNESEIVSEKLVRLSGKKPEELLKRTGSNVTGLWGKNPQFRLIKGQFRSNALLLSLAGSLAPALAEHICVGFIQRLEAHDLTSATKSGGLFSSVEYASMLAARDEEFRSWLLGRLRSADVGVDDLKPRKVVTYRPAFKFGKTSKRPLKKARIAYRLVLHHGSSEGSVSLPYSRESLGTRRLIEMSPILYGLARGEKYHAAFVDEFDASMHPMLLQELIGHFNCNTPAAEVSGQLVFTTHETALMEGEARGATLRRDQVWFTEKDSSGASRLYSLVEFKERNILNMRRRYLQGRYGALPSLGRFGD